MKRALPLLMLVLSGCGGDGEEAQGAPPDTNQIERLATPEEVETWMTAPPEEALKLQRPLPDGALRIVARYLIYPDGTRVDVTSRKTRARSHARRTRKR